MKNSVFPAITFPTICKPNRGNYAKTACEEVGRLHFSISKDVVTLINPSIGINVNILPWFRITANAGYRFTGGVGDKTYDNSNKLIFDADDYNAPTFSLSFFLVGLKSAHL